MFVEFVITMAFSHIIKINSVIITAIKQMLVLKLIFQMKSAFQVNGVDLKTPLNLINRLLQLII